MLWPKLCANHSIQRPQIQEVVFCLQNEFVEFLSYNHANGLTASFLHKLQIPHFIKTTRGFAVLSCLYTKPLQRMTEDKTIGFVEMGRSLAAMVAALEEAPTKP